MRLKHACSIYGDYGLNISADEYVDDGIPLIRTSDFDDLGRLYLSNPKMVSENAANNKMLQCGDILFSRAGTIGRCMIFNRTEPASFAAYLVRFRPMPSKVEARFIGWWAQSNQYWDQIGANTIESTIGNFNAEKLGNLNFPNHSLNTQKAIAAFLDRETARIDQLIEKRHTFLALLEEKERSIAAQAVNGALVATERDGERGWFGTIPSGWGLLRGKFLFSERQDKSETGDEELLSVSHLTGVTKRSEKDVNMFLAESMEGYKLVSPSDVVVNTMWAWMGAMGVSASEGLISPSYGVYAQTASSYDSAYLDLLLRSKPFVAEVNRRSKGVWSSRLRLYPDAFLDIRFPVPPKVDQERILAVLERELGKERKLASLSRTSIDRLREYRSALITAAVTGQIDVTSWDKRGETDRRLEKIEREMAS